MRCRILVPRGTRNVDSRSFNLRVGQGTPGKSPTHAEKLHAQERGAIGTVEILQQRGQRTSRTSWAAILQLTRSILKIRNQVRSWKHRHKNLDPFMICSTQPLHSSIVVVRVVEGHGETSSDGRSEERSAHDLRQAHEGVHTERTVRSQSFSSSPTTLSVGGGDAFQVLKTPSKHSRTVLILGRFCESVAQHRPSISHRLSVNHVPFTPSGLSGRSPPATLRVTMWSLSDANGG